MASRLHRIGNIYTRIEGLLSKGHIKDVDKPIWFEVYKNFPPKYDPTYKRVAPQVTVRNIFYKEDILRAKIQKRLPRNRDLINLKRDEILFSQKLLQSCQEYISQGMSEDEAVEKVFTDFNVEESNVEATEKTKNEEELIEKA